MANFNIFKWDKYNKIKRAGVEIGGQPYLLSEAETPKFLKQYGGGKSLEQLNPYGGNTSANTTNIKGLFKFQQEHEQNVAAKQKMGKQRLAYETKNAALGRTSTGAKKYHHSVEQSFRPRETGEDMASY